MIPSAGDVALYFSLATSLTGGAAYSLRNYITAPLNLSERTTLKSALESADEYLNSPDGGAFASLSYKDALSRLRRNVDRVNEERYLGNKESIQKLLDMDVRMSEIGKEMDDDAEGRTHRDLFEKIVKFTKIAAHDLSPNPIDLGLGVLAGTVALPYVYGSIAMIVKMFS